MLIGARRGEHDTSDLLDARGAGHATQGMFCPESIIAVQKRLGLTSSDEFQLLWARGSAVQRP